MNGIFFSVNMFLDLDLYFYLIELPFISHLPRLSHFLFVLNGNLKTLFPLLGRKWHNLSKEEQQKYYDKARAAREKHLELYPDWSARDNYGKKKRRKKEQREKERLAAQAAQQQSQGLNGSLSHLAGFSRQIGGHHHQMVGSGPFGGPRGPAGVSPLAQVQAAQLAQQVAQVQAVAHAQAQAQAAAQANQQMTHNSSMSQNAAQSSLSSNNNNNNNNLNPNNQKQSTPSDVSENGSSGNNSQSNIPSGNNPAATTPFNIFDPTNTLAIW